MLSKIIRMSLGVAAIAAVLPQVGLGQQTPAQQQANNGAYQPNPFPETYQQGGYFYPGMEFRALPGFRASSAFYWSQYRRAEQTLSLLVNDASRNFYRSADYRKALADEQAAWESLNAIRSAALSEVRQDPAYKASIDLQVKLQQQIRDMKDSDSPIIERVISLATLKLSYAATSGAMEAAAVSADPKIADARQRLIDASARVSAQRQRYDDTVRTDPQIIAARRMLEDSRTQALAANAQFLEADRIANVGLDFAYHLPQNSNTSPYGYGGGYGYSGYGGGYGGYNGGFQVGYPSAGR